MKNPYSNLTVVDIEKREGINYQPRNLEYALPAWYNSIRNKRLAELTNE